MKKRIKNLFGICTFFILLLILIPTTSAIGLGSITKNINVELGTLRTVEFYVLNSDDQTGDVILSTSGLLKDKVILSKTKISVKEGTEFYKTSATIRIDSCIPKQTDTKTYISAAMEQTSGQTIGAVAQSTLTLGFILNDNIYCNNSQEQNGTEGEEYFESNQTETEGISTITKDDDSNNEQNKKILDYDQNTTMILIIVITSVIIVLIISSLFVWDYIYVKKKKMIVNKKQQAHQIQLKEDDYEEETNTKLNKQEELQNKNLEQKTQTDSMDNYMNSLKAYIKKMRENGYPDEQIRKNLLSVGWKNEIIDKELK